MYSLYIYFFLVGYGCCLTQLHSGPWNHHFIQIIICAHGLMNTGNSRRLITGYMFLWPYFNWENRLDGETGRGGCGALVRPTWCEQSMRWTWALKARRLHSVALLCPLWTSCKIATCTTRGRLFCFPETASVCPSGVLASGPKSRQQRRGLAGKVFTWGTAGCNYQADRQWQKSRELDMQLGPRTYDTSTGINTLIR